MKVTTALMMFGVTAVWLTGCGSESEDVASQPGAKDSKYLLADEPAGAVGVREARDKSKDQDEVVVVGRIGGRETPFVDGLAAFMIVDEVMKPCNEMGDDGCTKPWDYC